MRKVNQFVKNNLKIVKTAIANALYNKPKTKIREPSVKADSLMVYLLKIFAS